MTQGPKATPTSVHHLVMMSLHALEDTVGSSWLWLAFQRVEDLFYHVAVIRHRLIPALEKDGQCPRVSPFWCRIGRALIRSWDPGAGKRYHHEEPLPFALRIRQGLVGAGRDVEPVLASCAGQASQRPGRLRV